MHEQAQRYEGDPWDEIITAWIDDPKQRFDALGHPVEPFASTATSVTVADVLKHAIGKPQAQWVQADKNRVSRALRAIGWERYRSRAGVELEWRYRRVETE